MEALLTLVGLGLAAWVFFGPVVTFLKLRSVQDELSRARRELGDVSSRLYDVERRLAELGTGPPRGETAREDAPEEQPRPVTATTETPTRAESPRPTPRPTGPDAAPAAPRSIEHTIGVVWLTRIGTSAVLLGTAYFFKYAVDSDWIGPWPRIVLGAVTGIAALAVGERSRPRANRIWADLVTALGLGILLFAAYASYAFYALVPVGAAFAAFVVVACLGGALAVVHASQTILVFSLAAACSAPPLLSTGLDRPVSLFGYLLVVTALSHAAALYRGFRFALWVGLSGPAVLFAGWYDRFFDVDGAYASLPSRSAPLGAAALFTALWLVVHYRARRLPERRTRFIACYAAAASTAAFASLLYDEEIIVTSGMAALGVVFAIVSEADDDPWVLFVSLAASGASLLMLPAKSELHTGFIAVLLLWAALYFAAAARGIFAGAVAEADRKTRARLLVAATSGLVLVSIAFEHGLGDEGTLAAALLALVGAADLVLGAMMIGRAGRGVVASVPLGLALGLFAASLAFLFAGPVVTIAWAALGATVVGLARARGDRLWLAGALVILFATICRFFAVDWDSVDALRSEFVRSSGLSGRVEPPVLLNERAYALLGVGFALLAAGRLAGSRASRAFRYASGALVAAGHAALVALAVVEARNAATPIATMPPGRLDSSELYALLRDHEQRVFAASHRLSMVTTLVLGAYAALLISIGFGAREAGHRYLGLALFAGTLGKLLFSDIWELERVYQMLILVGVGALLLGASFLYARFGSRLLKILGGGGSAVTVALAVMAPSEARAAVDGHAFAHRADISGVTAPGLYRFELVTPLYRASRTEEPFADLRIIGPDGSETPYFVRPITEPPSGSHPASMLDPVTFPDGRVRATFDLGAAPVRHGSVRLAIDGEDFLRRTEIEVSDDGKEFAVIRVGGVVYRATHGATPSESLDVDYPPSAARYVRATLLPGSGNVVGFTGAEFSVPATSSAPVEGFPMTVLRTDRNVAEKTTLVVLDAGEPGVPIETIRLELETGGFFEREADVLAATDKVHWFPVGGGFIYRIPIAEGKWTESLGLGAGRSRKRYFAFRFHDGDDAPLGVRSATGEFVPQEIVFRAKGAGAHRALVGSAMATRPAYDLGSVVVRGVGDAPKEARLSPLEDNPDFTDLGAAPTLSERYGRYFAIALGLILVGLSAFAIKVMKRVHREAGHGE